MNLGILWARIGDGDRYRKHSQELLDRFADTNDSLRGRTDAQGVLPARAGAVSDPTRLARLADVALSGDHSQPVFVWFDLAKGLYQYRQSRFDAAVATSRANRTRIKALGAWDSAVTAVIVVEAMALHRTGDTSARRSLAEVKKLIDEKFLARIGADMNVDWQNWLVAQLLYREAEALLEKKKDEPKKKE